MRRLLAICLAVVLALGLSIVAMATPLSDDMELDTWTFGNTNPSTDCTWSAGYSLADYTSPVRSIRLYVADGGTVGRDAGLAFAYQDFPFVGVDLNLRINYKVAQQSDVPGSGGASSWTDVIIYTYDNSSNLLGSYTYRLSTVKGPMYSRNYRPNGNTKWILPQGISRDVDGDIHLPPIWYTLDVNPGQDWTIDWTTVSTVRVLLRAGGAFMYQDVIETYFDDLELTFTIPATIDIKPGSDPNSINLKGKGVIPVAILTTPDFDATTVDASTVTFGPGAATMVHKNAHLEDVDSDGDLDLLFHFRTQDTGITPGDTSATLTGDTYGGTPIEGSDIIRVK